MSARKHRWKHRREFKQDMVLMFANGGHKISDVARDLDIDRSVINRWVQEYKQHQKDAFPDNAKLRPQDEELRQLRRSRQTRSECLASLSMMCMLKNVSIFLGLFNPLEFEQKWSNEHRDDILLTKKTEFCVQI